VVVILLLLVTIGLLLLNTIGGWKVLQGALPIQLAFIVIYILMVYSAIRWSRGVLPLAAALGILLVIFSIASAPSWFERDSAGFAHPLLSPGIVGVITLLIIPVQILLVAFSMRGFNQGWNVEVERRDPSAGAPTGSDVGGYPDAPPFPA
jgi:hypothetical protein